MTINGTIATGAFDVLVEGKEAARKGDITDHGGIIVDGCPTVTIGGTALCAATVSHRFTCPDAERLPPPPVKHRGGVIVGPGAFTVLVAGMPAARRGDTTICLGPESTVADGDGKQADAAAHKETECEQLWKKYQREAAKMLEPAGDDARERNKIISGAYADLFLRDHTMVWAGLAGYASKQVGCAMDFAKNISDSADPNAGAMRAAADYTYEKLGQGNKDLFLDIYPVHRFFEENGYAKLAKCAAERPPPVPAALLDSFRALDLYKKTGDPRYLQQHLESAALHEQIRILQSDIYNDPAMQAILRANQIGIPFVTNPASVVMGSGCTRRPGDRQFNFDDGNRTRIYDVSSRMHWILKDIGRYYMKDLEGTPQHMSDMEDIRRQGRLAGGNYP